MFLSSEIFYGKILYLGDTAESVLDLGKQGALEFDLSITHIDIQSSPHSEGKMSTHTVDPMSTNNVDLMAKVDKMVEEMYMHTSNNGLFVLLLGGELGNNSVATFKLVKAPL